LKGNVLEKKIEVANEHGDSLSKWIKMKWKVPSSQKRWKKVNKKRIEPISIFFHTC
jgi:hypothetical protein